MKSRYKESTIDRYTYVFNLHILPYFGKRPISGITPKDIRAWQTELIDCYTINKLALYSENTSISLTLHLGRDCRPINKQKKVHLNASTQMDLFYLFIVLLVKRKLFNNDYYFILCLYLSQSLILKGLKFYKNIFLPLFSASVSCVGTEVVRLKVCYFLQQLFTFQPLKCYPFR